MGQSYSYLYSYWYSTSNNIEDTIKKLSEQHAKLTKKIQELENKNKNIIRNAIIEFKKGKQIKALSLMKIKTLYDHEINKIENLLFCISTQELALNSSCTLQDSLQTIKHASSTMSALNTNIDLSKIDDTIDVVNDTQELNNEIQDTLSHQSFQNPTHATEDELIQELKNLCNSDQIPTETISLTPLPEAPSHEIHDTLSQYPANTDVELLPIKHPIAS